MTIRSRLDGFERELRAATVALSRAGRLPVRIVVINDPEDEASLAPYRLPPEVQTIEIGGPQFEGFAAPLRE